MVPIVWGLLGLGVATAQTPASTDAPPVPAPAPAPAPAAAAEPEPAPAPAPTNDRISLDAAMEAAAERAVQVRVASAQLDGARSQAAAAITSVLPMVQAQGGLQVWDQPATFSFAGDTTTTGTASPIDCAAIPAPFDTLCASLGEPTTVREQLTWSGTVRVVQPITGIGAGVEQTKAANAAKHAAEAGLDGQRISARFAAAEAWYGALEAEAQVEVAASQVRSLEERERSVASAVEAKAAVKNDLLQVRLALAQARQAALAVQVLLDASYRRLSIAVGGDGTPLRPDGVVPDPSVSDVEPEQAMIERALGQRAELRALRKQGDAARAQANATSWQRAPQIAAIASVTHQEGQSLGTPPNSGFVGVDATWTVWAWNRQGALTSAARSSADQVALQLEAAEAGVRLEVATRRRAVETARTSLEVSSESVEQAEENLALFRIRYDSGAATTLELLDAENQVVRAKSNELTARYGLLRAEAALTAAIGDR